MVSSYDLREHAFTDTAEGDQFLQALCTHCVPPDKVTDQSGTGLKMPRCMACLLILGDKLADQLGDGERWGVNR